MVNVRTLSNGKNNGAEVDKAAWVRTFVLNYIDIKNMIKEKMSSVRKFMRFPKNKSEGSYA